MHLKKKKPVHAETAIGNTTSHVRAVTILYQSDPILQHVIGTSSLENMISEPLNHGIW